MVMYGIYNSDTLEDLINTCIGYITKLLGMKDFAGQIKDWYHWYLSSKGIQCYAVNSLPIMTTAREKYVKMYESFINQLREYVQGIRILL